MKRIFFLPKIVPAQTSLFLNNKEIGVFKLFGLLDFFGTIFRETGHRISTSETDKVCILTRGEHLSTVLHIPFVSLLMHLLDSFLPEFKVSVVFSGNQR